MRWLYSLMLVLLSWGVLTSSAQAQFINMAASVPNDANVLMLMSVDRILASQIAQREQWQLKFDNAYSAGLTQIPPDTTRVLVATELDIEYLKPGWELAVMELSREPSLPYIAKQLKGQVDKIGTVGAVALPNDSYIVQLTPSRLAAYSPANRQAVGRWLSDIKARSAVGLSAYLKSALETASKGQADIVQAMDLEFAVPQGVIRQRLDEAHALKGKKIDLDQMATLLSGIKGITLTVQIENDVQGEISIEFADDTSPLATLGKSMLIEALDHRGASIPDLDTWQGQAQGTHFTLSGPLSASGLRKVLSLVQQPIPQLNVAPPLPSKTPPPTEESLKLMASQQYFKATQAILRDCASEYRSAETITKGALWLERFANRLDKLPMLNVDEDLVNYGMQTASALRAMAAGVRSSSATSSARTAQVVQEGEAYGSFGYDPGYWSGYGRYGWGEGYVQWKDVQGTRTAIRAEERNNQAQTMIKGKEAIANATGQIRKLMVDRYKAEF